VLLVYDCSFVCASLLVCCFSLLSLVTQPNLEKEKSEIKEKEEEHTQQKQKQRQINNKDEVAMLSQSSPAAFQNEHAQKLDRKHVSFYLFHSFIYLLFIYLVLYLFIYFLLNFRHLLLYC
jgi:hypothetical protein